MSDDFAIFGCIHIKHVSEAYDAAAVAASQEAPKTEAGSLRRCQECACCGQRRSGVLVNRRERGERERERDREKYSSDSDND